MFHTRLTLTLTALTLILAVLLLAGCTVHLEIDPKPPFHVHLGQDAPSAATPAQQTETVTVPVTVSVPFPSLHLVNVHDQNASKISDALGLTYRVDSQKVLSITDFAIWAANYEAGGVDPLQPKLALAHQLTESVPITILMQGKSAMLTLLMINTDNMPINCPSSQHWVWQETKFGTNLSLPSPSTYTLLTASVPADTVCRLPNNVTSLRELNDYVNERNVWVDFLLLENERTHQTELLRLLKTEDPDSVGGGSEATDAFCSQWQCDVNWIGEWFCYIVGCQ